MRFNPFFHLIEFVRAPALGMIPEASTVVVVLAMTVGGWLVASLVYRRYSRYIPLWV
jgi:lipopolysaccharide transport system permease protein